MSDTETTDAAIVDAVPANPEPSPFDDGLTEEEIRAELAGVDVGTFAADEMERDVFQYLRRRGQLEADIERIKTQTAAMIRSLESRLKGLDYVYGGMAQAYAREHIKGKAKSVKTPFGTLGFRTSPEGIDVVTPAELIEAAQSNMDLMGVIRIKEEVNKTALNELFKRTGELPVGCDYHGAFEKFFIKV